MRYEDESAMIVKIEYEVLETLLESFENQTNGLRRRPGVEKAIIARDGIIKRAKEALSRAECGDKK